MAAGAMFLLCPVAGIVSERRHNRLSEPGSGEIVSLGCTSIFDQLLIEPCRSARTVETDEPRDGLLLRKNILVGGKPREFTAKAVRAKSANSASRPGHNFRWIFL
jgi:hypothetical protein